MDFSSLMMTLYKKCLQCRSIVYKHHKIFVLANGALADSLQELGIRLPVALVAIDDDTATIVDPARPSNRYCPLDRNVNNQLDAMMKNFNEQVDALIVERDKEEPDKSIVQQCIENLLEMAREMVENQCYGLDILGPMTDIMTELCDALEMFKEQSNNGNIFQDLPIVVDEYD